MSEISKGKYLYLQSAIDEHEVKIAKLTQTISDQHVLLIKAYGKLRFAAGFSVTDDHGESIREVSMEIQRYLDKQLEVE